MIAVQGERQKLQVRSRTKAIKVAAAQHCGGDDGHGRTRTVKHNPPELLSVAIVLTQVILRNEQAPRLAEQIYQALGAVAVVSLWISWLAPEGMIYSGVPIILSWGMLVGWSTLRLIRRLAREPLVDGNILMGATAGYLQIGLTAALVMSAVEAIQPGSFTSVGNQNINAETVPNEASYFSAVNYFAFSCLTTVGFGDIRPDLPVSRLLSVTTSIIGPLYLAAVMGILIGRYSSNLKEGAEADDQITSRSENSPT